MDAQLIAIHQRGYGLSYQRDRRTDIDGQRGCKRESIGTWTHTDGAILRWDNCFVTRQVGRSVGNRVLAQ